MLVYPILNFVLPLMLSSFVLVDKPPSCLKCQIKKEHRIIENAKIERVKEIDSEVISLKSSAMTDDEFVENNVH